MAAQDQKEPHALTLKVLRASRPSLVSSPDLYQDPTSQQPGASTSAFTLTPLLALPTSFGNINLGETFSGVVTACNDSPHSVYDASMRIEMQSQTSRVLLWETAAPPPNTSTPLAAGESLDAPLIEHEIREPGLHALTCSVSYWIDAPRSYLDGDLGPQRVQRTFRKLYKFQVTNPVSVKTKVHVSRNVAASVSQTMQHTVFLEVQVQNICPHPLFLQSLIFEPTETMAVRDLTQKHTEPIAPGDVTQCLFCISTKVEYRDAKFGEARQTNGVIPLGKLDIRWRGRMGEPGHLSTSRLVRRIVLEQPALPRVPPAVPTLQVQSDRNDELQDLRQRREGSVEGITTATLDTRQSRAPETANNFGDLYVRLYMAPLSPDTAAKSGEILTLSGHLVLRSIAKRTDVVSRKMDVAIQQVDYDSAFLPLEAVGTDAELSSPKAEMDFPLPWPMPITDVNDKWYPCSFFGGAPGSAVHYCGASLTPLDTLTFDHASDVAKQAASSDNEEPADQSSVQGDITEGERSLSQALPLHSEVVVRAPFKMQCRADVRGIHTVGGLRVLLLRDSWSIESGTATAPASFHPGLPPCTLVEYGVIAEVNFA